MLLKITHKTDLIYSDFINESVMELRVAPRQEQDQHRLSFDLALGPPASVTNRPRMTRSRTLSSAPPMMITVPWGMLRRSISAAGGSAGSPIVGVVVVGGDIPDAEWGAMTASTVVPDRPARRAGDMGEFMDDRRGERDRRTRRIGRDRDDGVARDVVG